MPREGSAASFGSERGDTTCSESPCQAQPAAQQSGGLSLVLTGSLSQGQEPLWLTETPCEAASQALL
jgi:hypothetical protein